MEKHKCEGCIYWRSLAGGISYQFKCCHYLLDIGHSRKREGEMCLSRVESEKQKKAVMR